MRITRVQVEGLFGVFDHDIPLNPSDRVTIITGPNGFGKTILLKMLEAVFNGKYGILRAVPFRQLRISLSDGAGTVTVNKTPNGKSGDRLQIAYRQRGKPPKTHELAQSSQQRLWAGADYLEHFVGGLDRIGPRQFRYAPTGETLEYNDAWERFSDQLDPALAREFAMHEPPSWLDDLQEAMRVRFIDTQRLQSLDSARLARRAAAASRGRDTDSVGPTPTVAAYASDLAKQIQSKLAESATLSQSLDRTFPARVVHQGAATDVSADSLRTELARLDTRRAELREAGLLDTETDTAFQLPTEIDDRTKGVLTVYVQDVYNKLSVFDDLAARADLFKRIVNERFLYKSIVVGKEAGFSFRTPNGDTLLPTHLSSGEQHELVMLYELLFKVEPSSLILLDEPEISLHVAWQRAFLRDLLEVAGLRDFDVLAATHSPQIIGERWDLTVDLTGPEVGGRVSDTR
jgi:predicted ATP-binding protein involved in virulence